MKNTTYTTFKNRAIYWTTAVVLALIPLTAIASYMTEQIEQQPRSYTECIENNCKVIAVITPPPVARYELVVKQAMTKTERKLDTSAEAVKQRDDYSKDYMKRIAVAQEDGVITAFERILLVAGI